jgi:hypothetical protein
MEMMSVIQTSVVWCSPAPPSPNFGRPEMAGNGIASEAKSSTNSLSKAEKGDYFTRIWRILYHFTLLDLMK